MKSAKKYGISLLIFLFSTNVIASDFFLRLKDNSEFTVIFNKSVPSYGCRVFQITNLVAGNYPIEIYDSCFGGKSPCFFPIYRGIVTVPKDCQIMAYLDSFNILQTKNIVSLTGIYDFGYGKNDIVIDQKHFVVHKNNLNDSIEYIQAKKVLSEISNAKLKLAYLKHCIYFHEITSKKLAELMLDFSFDKDRIDLASFSYFFTTDKENFSLIYDSLIFNSSRQQLDEFINYLSINRRN